MHILFNIACYMFTFFPLFYAFLFFKNVSAIALYVNRQLPRRPGKTATKMTIN